MNNRIVYQVPGEPVSVLIPAACGLSLSEIGAKDVPAGIPFWLVSTAFIPSNREYRDAWELDVASMGQPSGIGGKQ